MTQLAVPLGQTPLVMPAALPRLTKKTVQGPTASDCGGFNWVCQWELDKKTTKGGWVVQKVELPYDVKDCSGKPVDPIRDRGLRPSWYPLWEAWRINKDQKVTTYAQGGDPKDDQFATPGTGPDTKGTVTAKGTAQFFDGLTLPSTFQVSSGSPAGILPHTNVDPALTSLLGLAGGTGPISHELRAAWDCCTEDKTTKIVTS